MCKERFGVKVVGGKAQRGPSRRQKKCTDLRKEIKLLTEKYANAPDKEKLEIKTKQQEQLKRLRLAKRAETLRKNRKEFSKNCGKFLNNPYSFARNVIAPRPHGNLNSSKEIVEDHIKKAHEDKNREKILQPLENEKNIHRTNYTI